MTTREHLVLGAYGEQLAAQHLIGQGMVVLDRNWRCPAGELDLVLRDGEDVVVCEVKTRRGLAQGPPVAAVGPDKVARLWALAEHWVLDRGIARPPIRLDLVGVLVPPSGSPVIDHVRGVH